MDKYTHVKGNKYKIQYFKKDGKSANRYYIKVHCTICGSVMFQHETNYKRTNVSLCSKECIHKHFKKQDGEKKFRRGSLVDGKYNSVMIKNESHPAAKKGFVHEHRLVMEKLLNRYLTDTEVVHHINMVPIDNSESNLYLCENNVEHNLAHASLNACVKDLIKNNIIGFKNGRYYVKNSSN